MNAFSANGRVSASDDAMAALHRHIRKVGRLAVAINIRFIPQRRIIAIMVQSASVRLYGRRSTYYPQWTRAHGAPRRYAAEVD